MLLKWARAVNACQHRDRKIEFGPGLTAICGPNGAGKSNFVGLARCSVTNDFSSMGDTKESNICRYADDEEPAFVETCWGVDAGEMTVRRALRGTRSCILLNGEELTDLTGKEKPITEKALKLLGTSADIMNDFMFADYASLQAIIKGSKADRSKLFTSLCGVSAIEKLDAALRTQMAADKAVCDEFSPEDLDNAKLQLSAERKSESEIEKKLSSLQKSLISDEEIELLREDKIFLESTRDKLVEAKKTLTRSQDLARKHKHLLPELKDALVNYQFREKMCRQWWSAANEAVSSLKREISSYQTSKEAHGRVIEARKQLAKAEPTTPEKTRVTKTADELESLKATLSIEGKQINDQLTVIENSGKGVCETCGQLVDISPTRVQKLKEVRESLRKQYKAVVDDLVAVKNYQRELQQYELDHKKWKLSLLAANETISRDSEDAEAYTRLGPIDAQKAKLKRRVNQASLYQKSADHYRNEVDLVRDKISTTKQRLANEKETIEECQRVVASFVMPDSLEIDKLTKKIREAVEISAQYRELQMSLKLTREAIEKSNELIANLTQKEMRLSRIKEGLEIQRQAREVCGRDRLPARIVNSMLLKTTRKVNQLLNELSAGFEVAVDPDEFSFVAVHRDGRQESAKRLSTGQGLTLGIAFWLARSATFAGRLPLFCLDEPTAHIDSSRLIEIAQMFGRLSDKLYQTGRQGIIITHHRPVAEIATRVFNIHQEEATYGAGVSP